MNDKKIEQRLKSFQNTNRDFLNERIEAQLSLRKKKLFEKLMKKRQENTMKILLNIDLETLNIPQDIIIEFQNVKETEKIAYLEKVICSTGKDTSESLMNAMWNQNTFFLYSSSTHNTCDLFKWAIKHLLEFTKEFEGREQNHNKNDIDVDNDEEDILITQELFTTILAEAYESNDLSVKNTTIEILLNYSVVSSALNNYFLQNIQYIYLLYKLTYINNIEIIHIVILLIHNILYDSKDSICSILNEIPIHIRICEVLKPTDEYIISSLIKNDLLFLIFLIAGKLPYKYLHQNFESYIFIISHLFTKNEINYEALYETCLSLLLIFSNNQCLSILIISTGIGNMLLNQLKNKDLIWTYVYQIVSIFGNLLYENDIVNHLLSLDILKIFQKIINTYINSCKKEENVILSKLVFALSNITGGTDQQINAVFSSSLPETIKRICKIKSDISIDYEVVMVYMNAVKKSNDNTILNILNTEIISFLCEEMYKTGNDKLLIVCIKCIQAIIDKVNMIYHTYENIKNELMKYGGKKKIEELSLTLNPEVSAHANALLTVLEKNQDEDLDII